MPRARNCSRHVGASDEDRDAEALREVAVCGADDGRLLALRKDDALWIGAHGAVGRLQPSGDGIKTTFEMGDVGVDVDDWLAGDA
jgi:ligand-binding sensor domain-containing protein